MTKAMKGKISLESRMTAASTNCPQLALRRVGMFGRLLEGLSRRKEPVEPRA